MTLHPNYKGPYSVAMVGARPFRHTDGAMILMGYDATGQSAPVLNIPMRLKPKRGEGWITQDPDQEAFAALVVNILNSHAEVSQFAPAYHAPKAEGA